MSTAYNIPPVVQPKDVPAWLLEVISNMQPGCDETYRQRLDGFFARSQKWIDDNNLARSLSAHPETYTPTLFTEQPPARECIIGHLNGSWESVYTLDPNVHPPVLPAYEAPPANPGISTGAPAADSALNAGLATIIRLLSAQGKDLAAIKAKLNIQ